MLPIEIFLPKGKEMLHMSKRRKVANRRRFDPRAMESVTAKIGKLMKEQQFESLEDAQRFLNENVLGRNLDNLEIAPRTALDKAQMLVYRAFEETSQKKRISMAERALEVSPDCADAYIILAEDKARDAEQEIDFYRRAVEAGQRALGEEVLNDPETMFWTDHSTRPLIRAMAALAEALKSNSQDVEAIEMLSEVLKLNPSDNTGSRLTLVPWLLESGRLDEAESILDRFPADPMAHMRYSRALLLFAREGGTPRAGQELKAAINWNPFVLEIVIGQRKLIFHEGPFSPRSPEEADHYVVRGIDGWRNTRGAIEWLIEYIGDRLQKTYLDNVFPGNDFAVDH
ncbi:MAG: hypothetical protein AB7W16_11975 [Candidatus Obscuribacterales bacterium]